MSGVEIRVRANTSQARREMQRLETSIDKLENNVSKTVKTFRNLAIGITSAFAAASIVGGINRATDAVKNYENRIKLVTRDADKAKLVLNELYDVAARSRTRIDGAIEVFNRFGLALANKNISADRLINVTESIQKATVISGASAESANAALVQLGQGLASGELRGQELNSVREQIPRVAQAIADGIGVQLGALKKLGEEGALTTQVVLDALESQAFQIDEQFALLDKTIGGVAAVLKNELGAAISEIDKQIGLSNFFVKFIEKLSEQVFMFRSTLSTNVGRIKSIIGTFVLDLIIAGIEANRAVRNLFGIDIIQSIENFIRSFKGIITRTSASFASLYDTIFFKHTPVITEDGLIDNKVELRFVSFFDNFDKKLLNTIENLRSFKGKFDKAIKDIFFTSEIQTISTPGGLEEIEVLTPKTLSDSFQTAYELASNMALSSVASLSNTFNFEPILKNIKSKFMLFQNKLDAIIRELFYKPIKSGRVKTENAFGGMDLGSFSGLEPKGIGEAITDIYNNALTFAASKIDIESFKQSFIKRMDLSQPFYTEESVSTPGGLETFMVPNEKSPYFGLIKMLENIKSFSKNLLNSTLFIFEGFTSSIANFFEGLYEAVIGNSYFTALIAGIINKSEMLLESGGKGPLSFFQNFASTVVEIFNKLKTDASKVFEETMTNLTTRQVRPEEAFGEAVAFNLGKPARVKRGVFQVIDGIAAAFQVQIDKAEEIFKNSFLFNDKGEFKDASTLFSEGKENVIEFKARVVSGEFAADFKEKLEAALTTALGGAALGAAGFIKYGAKGLLLRVIGFTFISGLAHSEGFQSFTKTLSEAVTSTIKGSLESEGGFFANVTITINAIGEGLLAGLGSSFEDNQLAQTLAGIIGTAITVAFFSDRVRLAIMQGAGFVATLMAGEFHLMSAFGPAPQFAEASAIKEQKDQLEELKSAKRDRERLFGKNTDTSDLDKQIKMRRTKLRGLSSDEDFVKDAKKRKASYKKFSRSMLQFIKAGIVGGASLLGTIYISDLLMNTEWAAGNESLALSASLGTFLALSIGGSIVTNKISNGIETAFSNAKVNAGTGSALRVFGRTIIGTLFNFPPAALLAGAALIVTGVGTMIGLADEKARKDRLSITVPLGLGVDGTLVHKPSRAGADKKVTDEINELIESLQKYAEEKGEIFGKDLFTSLINVENMGSEDEGIQEVNDKFNEIEAEIRDIIDSFGKDVGGNFSYGRRDKELNAFVANFQEIFKGFVINEEQLRTALTSGDPFDLRNFINADSLHTNETTDFILKEIDEVYANISKADSIQLISSAFKELESLKIVTPEQTKAISEFSGSIENLTTALAAYLRILGKFKVDFPDADDSSIVILSQPYLQQALKEMSTRPRGPITNNAFASGGYISGEGGPREDKIPAMLSNGEFVIQASSVKKYGRGFFATANRGLLTGFGGGTDDEKTAMIGGNRVSKGQKYTSVEIKLVKDLGLFEGELNASRRNFENATETITVESLNLERIEKLLKKTDLSISQQVVLEAQAEKASARLLGAVTDQTRAIDQAILRDQVMASRGGIEVEESGEDAAERKARLGETGKSAAESFYQEFNTGLAQGLKTGDFSSFGENLLNNFTGSVVDNFASGITESLLGGLVGSSDSEGNFNAGPLSSLFGSIFGFGENMALKTGEALTDGAKTATSGEKGGLFKGLTETFTGVLGGIFGEGGGISTLLGGLFGGGSGGGGIGSLLKVGLGFLGFPMNSGGIVPHTPFSKLGMDTVPTMLTPGELVVPANKVDGFMNNNSRSTQQFNINVSGDVSRQTRKEIVQMIPQITSGVNMANKENNFRR